MVELDQFYTNPKISNKLVKEIFRVIPSEYLVKFIEPSAGSGNFIDSLMLSGIKRKNILAYDIDPKVDGIITQDYLTLNKRHNKGRTVVGNPPFGKRSSLAIQFINLSLKHSEYVAMILPKQFNRFLTQKQINPKAKLIYSKTIEKDSFLVKNRKYHVNTVFQIWTTNKDDVSKDLRLLKSEPRKHEDFETRIHNNTELTLKYFKKDNFFPWDLALHRQGFYDYNERITDPENLIKNRQYFFIKAKNKTVLNRIMKMDINKLSDSNTQTPGYSTTDFVKAYKKIKRKRNENDTTKPTNIYKK